MRNFSWNCFQKTGSVDAYLLYKDLNVNEEEYINQFEQELEHGEDTVLES